LAHLDAELIVDFLNHLEQHRGNCIRTRNARLASIRSFFQFAALEVPECLALINRVLAVPMKRYDRPPIRYLSREEIEALIAAPHHQTWVGRRDIAMFSTLYNTGARVSELISIRLADVYFSNKSASISLHGKGRKNRAVPLWKSTAKRLKNWMQEIPNYPDTPLFPDAKGNGLSRSGVEFRLKCAAKKASETCVSISRQSVSPHLIRHTTAMHMLQSGVDIAVIALWLGHESIQTTHMYMEADLHAKEIAMSKIEPSSGREVRFRPKDKLLQFLEEL
jgi:site-specific recombinase XerD